MSDTQSSSKNNLYKFKRSNQLCVTLSERTLTRLFHADTSASLANASPSTGGTACIESLDLDLFNLARSERTSVLRACASVCSTLRAGECLCLCIPLLCRVLPSSVLDQVRTELSQACIYLVFNLAHGCFWMLASPVGYPAENFFTQDFP